MKLHGRIILGLLGPWRWRPCDPSKRSQPFCQWCDITCQVTWILSITTVRTSSL